MADVIQTTQIKDLPDATSLATGDRIPLQKANGATSDIDYSTFVSQAVNFPVSSNMGNKSVVAGLNELYADRLSVVDDGVITDELNIYYNKEQVNSLISGVQSAYQSADNNLQNQINTLNSNLYNANLGTAINNNDDLDTYTKPGTYYCNSASKAETLAHCPVNNSGFKLLVIRTGYENANLIQIIEVPIGLNDGGSTYRRMGNPSAFGNWVKSPTRYDIDTLNNSLASRFIQTGWGNTITVTDNTPGIVIHGLLLISTNYEIQVWLPSTSDINICVKYCATDSNSIVAYTKRTTSGSISFGPTKTDESYTITRNGRSFTFTGTSDTTITWIGV